MLTYSGPILHTNFPRKKRCAILKRSERAIQYFPANQSAPNKRSIILSDNFSLCDRSLIWGERGLFGYKLVCQMWFHSWIFSNYLNLPLKWPKTLFKVLSSHWNIMFAKATEGWPLRNSNSDRQSWFTFTLTTLDHCQWCHFFFKK